MENVGFIALNTGADCTMDVFVPVKDYDGNLSYISYSSDGGERYINLSQQNNTTIDSRAILIPCDMSIIKAMLDYAEMQKQYQLDGSVDNIGAYYFSMEMRPWSYFEKDVQSPGFAGPFTAYASIIKEKPETDAPGRFDVRQAGISRARINCWTGIQGIVQYVGGLDLGEIDPDIPFFYRAYQISTWQNERQEYPPSILEKAQKTLRTLFARKASIIENDISGFVKNGFALKTSEQSQLPYFIMTEYTDLEKLLASRIKTDEGNVMSVADYLQDQQSKGLIAQPRPLAEHIHMRNMQESVSESVDDVLRL